MLTILALQIKQIINENLIRFSKRHVYKQLVTSKMRHFNPYNLSAN